MENNRDLEGFVMFQTRTDRHKPIATFTVLNKNPNYVRLNLNSFISKQYLFNRENDYVTIGLYYNSTQNVIGIEIKPIEKLSIGDMCIKKSSIGLITRLTVTGFLKHFSIPVKLNNKYAVTVENDGKELYIQL